MFLAQIAWHKFLHTNIASIFQKWFKCFEDVTSILFLASSSEFDQVLMEDRKTNRLKVRWLNVLWLSFKTASHRCLFSFWVVFI